jgi:hypothetical protein
MTTKSKILYGFLLIIFLVIGLVVGFLWKDFPLIKFNPEVKLSEVLSLIVTIGIGIFIPLLVKKWIEDSKSVKSYLVDEAKSIITNLATIKQKVKLCFDNGVLSQNDKDEVNYMFHSTELQITSFKNQMKVAFPSQEKKLSPKLSEQYNLYKDFVTDGPFMVSSFTRIDDRFYRDHNQHYTVLEGHLKTLIQEIYKF